MKSWFNEFNCGRRSLKEVREGRPTSAIVSENIDAVRELKMQDRHVIYREITASLCISSTSIHSILHEHLVVKKICSSWIPHNLRIAQKRFVLIGVKKCWKNTIAVLQKRFIRSSQARNHGSMRMSPKQQQSTVWVFEESIYRRFCKKMIQSIIESVC